MCLFVCCFLTSLHTYCYCFDCSLVLGLVSLLACVFVFDGDCWSVVWSFGVGFGGWFLGLGFRVLRWVLLCILFHCYASLLFFVITFGLYWFGWFRCWVGFRCLDVLVG